MSTVSELHKKWSKNPKYARAFAEMAPEYSVARAVIEARVLAGLTQEQLAERMETSQSAIARLESGRGRPSTDTLARLAIATGTELTISFTPKAVLNELPTPQRRRA